MTDNLKACPFCGGILVMHRGEMMGGYFAVCSVCHLYIPLGLDYERAVAQLNTRLIEDAQAAEITELRKQLEAAEGWIKFQKHQLEEWKGGEE